MRAVRHPIMVEHMGGETALQEAGTLELRSFSGVPPTFLRNVHVVAPELLPAGVVALLGVPDIRDSNLSLDAVMDNPDCIWERAVRRPWFWRARHSVCSLDTMSDVNMAPVELLHDVHEIDADDVRGCGGATAFTHEVILKVLQDGNVVCMPALVVKASQLPRLCDVSLGVPGLDRLGVCVDQHRTRQGQPLICHVGEKTLRTWWESNAGQAAPSINHDIDHVDVCPDLPAREQARVRTLLRKYEGVFEGRQITMPKPFSAEPVELKFVDDPKPQSVPEPRWTHACERYRKREQDALET